MKGHVVFLSHGARFTSTRKMLGMILFVATLHLALGYALAVYLGYAPLEPCSAVATETIRPSSFNAEIVITDDLEVEEPIEEAVAAGDGAGDSTDKTTIIEDETTETKDETETVVSSTSAEIASLPEKMARLLAISSEVRKRLAESVNRLWDFSEDNTVGQSEVERLSSALSEVIQKVDEEKPPSLNANDPLTKHAEPVLAARKKFLQHLSTAMDMGNHVDTGDDKALRQTLRHAILDVHDSTYEFNEAMADVYVGLLNEMDVAADKNQKTPADARIADRLNVLRSLEDFWPTDSDDKRQLVAAMIDVDRCRHLNSELGPTRCDRLIDHIVEIARQTIPDPYALEHYSGQRLVVLIPDKLPNAATEDIELARETVSKTMFTIGKAEYKITVTCAIAEATPNERPEVLFRRLAETLQEAKRYGRDRTFLHEGDYPAPVVPPHLDVEPRVIELT